MNLIQTGETVRNQPDSRPDIVGDPMTRHQRIEAEALTLHCYYCGAEPGEWCRAKSGRRATFLHARRERQAADVVLRAEGVRS